VKDEAFPGKNSPLWLLANVACQAFVNSSQEIKQLLHEISFSQSKKFYWVVLWPRVSSSFDKPVSPITNRLGSSYCWNWTEIAAVWGMVYCLRKVAVACKAWKNAASAAASVGMAALVASFLADIIAKIDLATLKES